MKNSKNTKRNILFFFLGLLTYLIFSTIYNWEAHKKAFIDGYNDVRHGVREVVE